jgi:hypothetical protein
MADIRDNRVAVYIDFDNIVISRYDEVHGKGRFTRDRVREYLRDGHDDQVGARLKEAAVDVGAMVDFASSFGTLVLTRAYADWSQPVNAEYRGQLVGRAVDLVQLFPAAAYGKNGADIRLAVDAIEDMFRLPDLTHLVIVAGDSDYIALAQRAKRLGRYVVAVGVAGSTSRSLAAACDRMVSYDALPGIAAIETIETIDDAPDATVEAAAPPTTPRKRASRSRTAKTTTPEAPAAPENVAQENPVAEAPAVVTTPAKKEAVAKAAPGKVAKLTDQQTQLRAGAGQLLQRALRLGHDNDEDAEWLESSTVKRQLLRMDPAFSEKELGYATFSDFANSFKFVELDDTHETRRLRLRRR